MVGIDMLSLLLSNSILRELPDNQSGVCIIITREERSTMDTSAHYRKIFRWNVLANIRMIDAIAPEGNNDALVELLSHILAAEHIWLLRIEGFDTRTREVWPLLALTECRERCLENNAIVMRYLANAEEEDLARIVTYSNTKDEAFSNSVADILTHVTHHSTYHRAQINSRLRALGAAPAIVDYISFARDSWQDRIL